MFFCFRKGEDYRERKINPQQLFIFLSIFIFFPLPKDKEMSDETRNQLHFVYWTPMWMRENLYIVSFGFLI